MNHKRIGKIKGPMTRKAYLAKSKANPRLRAQLHTAGVTYDDVARLARVSSRMVKYVIDGERTSTKVMQVIDKLSGVRSGDQPSELSNSRHGHPR